MIFRIVFLATYLVTYTSGNVKKKIKCVNKIPEIVLIPSYVKTDLKTQLESVYHPNWLINLTYFINFLRMPTWLL